MAGYNNVTILAPYIKNFDYDIFRIMSSLNWNVRFFPKDDITLDEKIEITLNEIHSKYLCIYSQNSKTTKQELEEMYEFLENDSNYWCIGKDGDYFTEHDIVQDSNPDKATCYGRPGIYRVRILKQYWNDAKQDAKIRSNNQSELVSHVGYLATKDGLKCKLYLSTSPDTGITRTAPESIP